MTLNSEDFEETVKMIHDLKGEELEKENFKTILRNNKLSESSVIFGNQDRAVHGHHRKIQNIANDSDSSRDCSDEQLSVIHELQRRGI